MLIEDAGYFFKKLDTSVKAEFDIYIRALYQDCSNFEHLTPELKEDGVFIVRAIKYYKVNPLMIKYVD